MFSAPGRGRDGVEQPGNIKHYSVGGQENRQDDEDDLKDAAREKCTHGGADCEDHANQGRKQRVLQVAPGASLCGVLLRHATKVAVLRSHPGPAGVSCSSSIFLIAAESLRVGAGSRLAKPSRSDARRAA
jgi:hypothetical protein